MGAHASPSLRFGLAIALVAIPLASASGGSGSGKVLAGGGVAALTCSAQEGIDCQLMRSAGYEGVGGVNFDVAAHLGHAYECQAAAPTPVGITAGFDLDGDGRVDRSDGIPPGGKRVFGTIPPEADWSPSARKLLLVFVRVGVDVSVSCAF